MQVTKKIKYLGIWLMARCTTIGEDNYSKLLQEITLDLERWKNLQLSLIGRIESIKMNILPRLLFLLQNVPIQLPKNYLKDWEKTINKFIWQGKKARIKLKMLQESKERGGFGLPDWTLYYQAAGITWLREWMLLRDTRMLILEGHDLHIGWHAYMWHDKIRTGGIFLRHKVRRALYEIWKKLKDKYYEKIPIWTSIVEAIVYPNILEPGKKPTYKEILTKEGELKTEQDLKKQGLETTWWTFAQIRERDKKDKQNQGIARDLQDIDIVILKTEEKIIKKSYKFLLDRKMEEEVVKETMITWARNFGYTIDLDRWQTIWGKNYKMTLATSYKENLLKMFYRWHLPPARLNKMFPNLAPNCWKCGDECGTYYHMWWTCPKTKKYWKKIKRWIEEITTINLELRPETFLLSMIPEKYEKKATYLIVHLITAARILFAQEWKNKNLPTDEQIRRKIMDCAELDRLTLLLKDKEETKYYESWNMWYLWIGIKKK